MNLLVHENPQQLAEAAARDFAAKAREAIETSGRFAVALAGGSTPKATYEVLARDYTGKVEWDKVHFFFGDERSVPPDHEDSNYQMARESLLDHVTAGSVHRMRGEMPPNEAAALYEEELREFFGASPGFDLILLGIGEDGHAVSLFPNTPALDITDRWVVANPVSKLETVRITLTLPVLNEARSVAFLVAGEAKAEVLKGILGGDADPLDYPAKLIQPAGGALWMVDRAAASLLD